MAAGLTSARTHRRLAGAGLVLAVIAVHLWLADRLVQQALNLALAEAMPARMEVVYLREMALAPPAPVAAPVRRRAAPAAAPPVAAVASAPAAVLDPEPVPQPPVAEASAPETAPTEVAAVDVPHPEPAASSAATAAPFEWPVSTRMRYLLTGNFRGEVQGQAQVEWIRAGSRYQVHLDVNVGFVASRRMSSDGDITPDGLAPRRYDQETKIVFDDARRAVVRFDGDQVQLSTGRVVPRPPGVQDTVSQFVQLSWLFASQPDRLRVGATVELPLAMPRNVSSWVYDVVEEETLYTTFGEVQTFHLKPRREPRAGGDMTVDIWIAPQLRHLPVRFRIRPDPDAYFDLMLDRKPELAAEPDNPRRPP